MKYGDVVPVTPDAPDRVAAVGRLQLPHLTCLRWQGGENLRVEAQHGPLRDTAPETAQGYRRVNDGPWVRVVLEQGNVRSHPVMMASPRASPGLSRLTTTAPATLVFVVAPPTVLRRRHGGRAADHPR